MALDLITQLKRSGEKLLETTAQGIELFSSLNHNKRDLELFLQYNLAELKFKPDAKKDFKTIVCTSNTRLIKVFQALKTFEKKKALASTPFSGIKTRNSSSILTFNLVDNKYNTVSLRAWEIRNFVTITEKNVEVLDVLLGDLLKRNNETNKDDLLFFR